MHLHNEMNIRKWNDEHWPETAGAPDVVFSFLLQRLFSLLHAEKRVDLSRSHMCDVVLLGIRGLATMALESSVRSQPSSWKVVSSVSWIVWHVSLFHSVHEGPPGPPPAGASVRISDLSLTNSLATSSLCRCERIRSIVHPVSSILILEPRGRQHAIEPWSDKKY